MKNESKNNLNGLSTMTPKTRSFFLANFIRDNGSLDTQLAADFFSVTSRTINNWVATGCPTWVDKHVALYLRSIPDTKEWDGFSFSHDGKQLLTPFKNHSFTASELLKHFFDKQFHRIDRAQNRKLNEQVESLRNEDEANAIRGEIDLMIDTLNKLKHSPIVAPKQVFSKSVIRK
ncbi:hypothetical protein [Shewanella fidelis]|uniref:Bacteriophage CI repressor n=1 Tax=Shewanella fidelis TaxID=173509 RepID=A0AAW8NNA9_9GAMM|nr:hypothetical protein [Shewanella fidelis]MDR8523835.1 hypothetical protein [Shewanella fidelis]MDW4810383.1 hypothetical protein [Shewanella fidelis]MDW4823729.1 hypothetical protein [Shewanella fidelis]